MDRRVVADAIRMAASERARMHGVELHAEWQDNGGGRLMMAVRRVDGSPGSGAHAVGRLLEHADAAGIPVVIDVDTASPRLMQYWHDFGFRLVDGDHDREMREIAAIAEEVDAHVAEGGDPKDLGVTTMFREPGMGPLLPEGADAVAVGTPEPTSPARRRARVRDLGLVHLMSEGMTGAQAGSRAGPGMPPHLVAQRMTARRRQSWKVPSFAGRRTGSTTS